MHVASVDLESLENIDFNYPYIFQLKEYKKRQQDKFFRLRRVYRLDMEHIRKALPESLGKAYYHGNEYELFSGSVDNQQFYALIPAEPRKKGMENIFLTPSPHQDYMLYKRDENIGNKILQLLENILAKN